MARSAYSDRAEAEAGERRAEADGELEDVDAPGRRGEEVARCVDEHVGVQAGGRGGDGLDAREVWQSGGGVQHHTARQGWKSVVCAAQRRRRQKVRARA